MALSGRDTDITSVMEDEEKRLRVLELMERSTAAPTAAEREDAKRQLAEVGASWRGFPGQRRRGDVPPGVCVR